MPNWDGFVHAILGLRPQLKVEVYLNVNFKGI